MTTSLPTYEEILNVWFHEKYTDKPFSKLWFTTPNSTNQINAVSLLHNIYIYIYIHNLLTILNPFFYFFLFPHTGSIYQRKLYYHIKCY